MIKSLLAALGVFALMAAATYISLFVAPTDFRQGLIYRIIYLHVASAWTGLTAFLVCFVANLLYVWKRAPKWDWLGIAAAEVGLAFTTIVLVSGPIWAHPVWGIWWTWSPRLTSTFVLWLLYVAYLLLRSLVEEPDRRALLSALFGIFAFIDVPLVFGSIRWWRDQHPQPVVMGEPGSGLEPMMYVGMLCMWAAMLGAMTLFIRHRYALEQMRTEMEILRRDVEAA